ncbi:MAG: hypothetical protein GY952_03090 [Rhodobacteraceae bacterium]|nr:hypothetical protein [Paracoccaceae bacterium]
MTTPFKKAVRVAHDVLDSHFEGKDLVVKAGDALLPMLVLMEYGKLAPNKEVIQFEPEDLEVLLGKALHAGAEYDAVVELCIIRANSGPFEPALKVFHTQALRGEIQRPIKPGPNPEKYKSRNYIIVGAVHSAALECGLKIYRNSSVSGNHESACDAVAEALGENGYHVCEYATVAKIASQWDLVERLEKNKANVVGKNN